MPSVTYLAFSDESNYNTGRYRGLGLVSLPAPVAQKLASEIEQSLQESNVRELKWKKVKSARDRYAAIKVIDICLAYVSRGELRVDVLIWDTEDSRHRVVGRDDRQNMINMYIQLFKNVLRKRWPSEAVWQLFPDEQSIIDWERMKNTLARTDRFVRAGDTLLDNEWNNLRRHFGVMEISETSSKESALIQVADLFVGVGVFSHTQPDVFEAWRKQNGNQMALPLDDFKEKASFSRKEKEHSAVTAHLLEKTKRSVVWKKGLRTFNPNYGINFWLYEPQRASDKAPRRR